MLIKEERTLARITNKEYGQMANNSAPSSPIVKNCLFAFLIGGVICTIGQVLIEWYKSLGMEPLDASAAASVTLILISALLTGFDLYEKIACFAGAGTLVPITGFANAVVSPAIEFKSEGYILGLGAKMFVIAGPVIVYGTLSAVIAGFIHYLLIM